jgi:hypothetical protein
LKPNLNRSLDKKKTNKKAWPHRQRKPLKNKHSTNDAFPSSIAAVMGADVSIQNLICKRKIDLLSESGAPHNFLDGEWIEFHKEGW